ncbi:MAG: branched-chain amino acid transport system ATP-binding protein [Actinomycetota bacterium]|jgi:branched-chain amino acid transport system ATP-binding protein|nr:branched-chain amino acid transport system ATP-binding protein [Actinomycetota bacterium]
MSLLEIRDLKAGYGSLPVLQGISFDVEEGETAVLLGLNGAGKTTTVLSLAGLLKPWSGTVHFNGEDITGMDPRKLVAKGVVLVPEGRRVFPALTVAQNLRLGAWPYKKQRKETKEIVERAVEYFPRLRERWAQLAGTLSGGEQQMLAIARGLMARPKLLLIDESSLGLSPKLTQTVFEVVDKINKDGTTVLMVEQNAGVLKLADRAFVMEKGTLIYKGSAAEGLDYATIQEAYLGMTA